MKDWNPPDESFATKSL